MEWQPIETAPKDGTFYIAWSSDFGPVVCNQPDGRYPGRWVRVRTAKLWAGVSDYCAERATHWMPLPPPPTAESPQEQPT